jgi:hypothetical protein
MLTPAQVAQTCIADEAANQPYEGKVAVGSVILNRMKLLYESDGSVTGTVERHFQFSGFWFSMASGHYQQDEFDAAGAATKAQELFNEFSTQPIWSDCARAWVDAMLWASNMDAGRPAGQGLSFVPGPEFLKLDRRTVMYVNPKISSPPWATPNKLVATIFQHSFFHA